MFSFLYGPLCVTCFNNSAAELLLNKLEEICLHCELLALCDSIRARGFELTVDIGFLNPST